MNFRILFLDDEPFHIKYYLLELQSEGCEVIQVSSVVDAITLVSNSQFDAMIVDIMMEPVGQYSLQGERGGMETGIYAIKDILAVQPNANVVVLTNVKSDKIWRKIRERYPDIPVFAKPDNSPPKFVAQLKRLLEKGGEAKK